MPEQKPQYAQLSEAEQLNLIEKFRQSARDWWAKMQRVENFNVPQTHPLYKKKMGLVARAHSIRTKIEAIPGFGTLFQTTEMGVWQVFAILAAGGAIAWAATVFKATSNEADRLEFEVKEYNRLISSGYSPEQAMSVVKGNQQLQQRNWSDVAYKGLQLLPWVGGAYILWKLYNSFKGSRNG